MNTAASPPRVLVKAAGLSLAIETDYTLEQVRALATVVHSNKDVGASVASGSFLMVRETALHKGHLDLMSRAADCGAVILPPMPAFYHRPQTIMDIIHQTIGKALDQVGIEHDLFQRWNGRAGNGKAGSDSD